MANVSVQLQEARNKRMAIFEGIANTGLADYVTSVLETTRTKNPFLDKLRTYEYSTGGILTWLTGVYQPFTCDKREINPDETIKKFLKTGSEIYCLAIEGVKDVTDASFKANKLCSIKKVKGKKWIKEVKSLLEEEIATAEDIAIWLEFLSQGIITGPAVKSKARKYGITNLRKLPEDVRRIGGKVLTLYDILTS